MFRLNFTTGVLGKEATDKLRRHQVTQTLRPENSDVVGAMLHRALLIGDQMEISLDGEVLDIACPFNIDRVAWGDLTVEDARRGGFKDGAELKAALIRAGYRFKPIEKYLFYRVQFTFTWLGG